MDRKGELELFHSAGECLAELEDEYLQVGIDQCKGLDDQTQLSAFLQMGIRSISLLRAMLALAEPHYLDAYDSVRRAFMEAWQLQFEFRLRDSGTKVQQWFRCAPKSWNANKTKLEAFISKRDGGNAGFGREWGELSEMAHPTLAAVVNSVAVTSTLRGLSPRIGQLEEALQRLTVDYLGLLNRGIWISLQEDPELIETQLRREKLTKSVKFHDCFFQVESAANGPRVDLVEEIRHRAYEIWKERVGRHALDDWLQAEAEVVGSRL